MVVALRANDKAPRPNWISPTQILLGLHYNIKRKKEKFCVF